MPPRGAMKKIIEYIILAFVLLLFFVLLSPRLPSKNFIATYIVPTGSMIPTIKSGSVALVNPKYSDLKVGDIIAFTSPIDSNQTIIHRIYQIDGQKIKTKGDNNNAVDAWTVSPELIKGKLIFAIPYLGYLAGFIKTKIGFAIVVGIPTVILLVSYILDIIDGIKEEKGKRKNLVVLLILPILLLPILKSKVALAQFSATATISGISFSMAGQDENNNKCDVEISGNGAGSVNKITCSKDRHIIIFHINNTTINNEIVNYAFTYDADSIKQATIGSFNLGPRQGSQKELVLGTCSNNVCVYAKSYKNIKLQITKN